jgi:branched-chain amino acid aminotransferase
VAWLDGKLTSDLDVSIFSHSLHYGTAVFEGIRYYQTVDGRRATFRASDHLARFARGLDRLSMEPPVSADELRRAMWQVIEKNGHPEGSLRPLAFFGSAGRGVGALNPVRIAVLAYRPAAPGAVPAQPLKLVTSARAAEEGWPCQLKLTGMYVLRFVARREALRRGCDDGLFLDRDGNVAEAVTANVFAVRSGSLATPPLCGPLVPGITRSTVLALADVLGIAAHQRPIEHAELLAADEIFLTSTVGGVQAVASIDGTALRAPGPVTTRLAESYRAVVRGGDERFASWLDYAPER